MMEMGEVRDRMRALAGGLGERGSREASMLVDRAFWTGIETGVASALRERFGLGMPVFADVADQRAQALKVLEEASELCESAKWYEKYGNKEYERRVVIDETADVYQTLVNLRASFGVTDDELDQAVSRCIARNKARGRY